MAYVNFIKNTPWTETKNFRKGFQMKAKMHWLVLMGKDEPWTEITARG
jgi:hypothetical protein